MNYGFYQLAALRIAELLPNADVSSPTKLEGGMRVDLHKRGTSRNRVLLIGQAIMPALIILTTSVSCAKRGAEVSEPPYRIVERILPFSSGSSDEENRQLVQRRSDAKPTLQPDQHGPPSPPKVTKVHAPDASSATAPRHASGKTNSPPLLDRDKEQLFQQFLEWRKRQTDVP
jgi:hypothetical protein